MDVLGFMLLAAFGILGLTPIIMAAQAQSIAAIILVAAAMAMAATILLTTPTNHEIIAAILWLGGAVTAGTALGAHRIVRAQLFAAAPPPELQYEDLPASEPDTSSPQDAPAGGEPYDRDRHPREVRRGRYRGLPAIRLADGSIAVETATGWRRFVSPGDLDAYTC